MNGCVTDPFDVALADAESPGCAKHHDPECLCDVDLDRVGIAAMERVPASIRDNVETIDDFIAWAERIASIMERGFDFDEALEARTEYELAATAPEVLAAIRRSVEAGLTLAQTTAFWDADATTVVRRWQNNPTITSAVPWLIAERMLGTTLVPYGDVAEYVGLSIHAVRNLRDVLKVDGRSPRRRYLDALKDEAHRLYDSGLHHYEIAHVMSENHGENIGRSRVGGWLRADRQP